jgi:murein L,D-transpeptidase YcbB/YkuD
MRVQDPMKYAEVLLSFAAPKANHTADSIKRMLGGEEKQIDFQTQIPVHVTYQTRSSIRPASCNSLTTSTASTPSCC